jgi:hypothetical protein
MNQLSETDVKPCCGSRRNRDTNHFHLGVNFPPNLLCNNLPQDPSGRISLSLHAEVEFLPLHSQVGDVESPGSRFAGVGLDPVVEVELPVG